MASPFVVSSEPDEESNHERKVALRSFDRLRMQGERIGLSFSKDSVYMKAIVLRKML